MKRSPSSSSFSATLTRRFGREGIALGMIVVAACLWSAAALGGPPPLRLAALAALAIAVVVPVVWRWPVYTVAWLPLLIVPPEVGKVFAHEIVLLLTAGILIAEAWRRRAAWLSSLDPLEIAVGLFVAWGIFTGLWARDPWWWIFGIRNLAMGALALWVSRRLVRFIPGEDLLTGIAAGACALGLATLYKAYQYGWFAAADQLKAARRSATDMGWGNANFIAALLTLMLPTAIHLAMVGKTRLSRTIGWIAMPLSALVVTIAASRGGALLVFAVALLAIFRSRIRPWVAVILGVAAMLVLFFGPGAKLLLERFTDVTQMTSAVIRLMYWRVAWQRVVDHWPWGLGLGGGEGYADRLFDEDPHNYWLVLAAEVGAVGLILWIAVLFLVWRRMSLLERTPETRSEGRAIQLTFLISQVNTMFEPTFQGLQYNFLWFWIVGAYLGIYEERMGLLGRRAEPAEPAPDPGTGGLPDLRPEPVGEPRASRFPDVLPEPVRSEMVESASRPDP